MNNNRGFTLVEVLCITVITSIISIMLFTVINSSQAQHTTQYKNNEELTQVSLVLKQISNDFRETISLQYNTPLLTLTKHNKTTTTYNYDSSSAILYRNGQIFAKDLTNFTIEPSSDLKSLTISIQNRHGENVNTTLYIRGE